MPVHVTYVKHTRIMSVCMYMGILIALKKRLLSFSDAALKQYLDGSYVDMLMASKKRFLCFPDTASKRYPDDF